MWFWKGRWGRRQYSQGLPTPLSLSWVDQRQNYLKITHLCTYVRTYTQMLLLWKVAHLPPSPTAFPKTAPECRPAPTFILTKSFESDFEMVNFNFLGVHILCNFTRQNRWIGEILMETLSFFFRNSPKTRWLPSTKHGWGWNNVVLNIFLVEVKYLMITKNLCIHLLIKYIYMCS